MSDIVAKVQKFYDEAGEYFSKTRQKKYGGEDSNWAEVRPYLKRLRRGDSVLDLGCGNGRLVTGLPRGVTYVGLDFSRTLLDEAKRLHPDYRFLFGDIAKRASWKALGGREWNAIFCVATLHHLPERKQQLMVLKEARNRLKKDGFLYLSVWNLWQARHLRNHLASLNMKVQNSRWLNVPFAGRWERFCFAFDKAYLAQLMDEAGLEIEDMYYADERGEKVDARRGRNLVAVGRSSGE